MAWNFGDEVQFGGGECHRAGFIIHFYYLAVEAGFYCDVVECLPVDPASWVRFPAGACKIFSLYDNQNVIGREDPSLGDGKSVDLDIIKKKTMEEGNLHFTHPLIDLDIQSNLVNLNS